MSGAPTAAETLRAASLTAAEVAQRSIKETQRSIKETTHYVEDVAWRATKQVHHHVTPGLYWAGWYLFVLFVTPALLYSLTVLSALFRFGVVWSMTASMHFFTVPRSSLSG